MRNGEDGRRARVARRLLLDFLRIIKRESTFVPKLVTGFVTVGCGAKKPTPTYPRIITRVGA